MRAIGTSQNQIYKILFVEIIILALLSVLLGGVLGSSLSIYFAIHPLVLKLGPEMMDLYKQWGVYDLTFPARLTLKSFISGIVPVLIMMILAVAYPAWKINRLRPIDAIEERSW